MVLFAVYLNLFQLISLRSYNRKTLRWDYSGLHPNFLEKSNRLIRSGDTKWYNLCLIQLQKLIDMEIKPVKSSRKPNYPSLDDFNLLSNGLIKYTPVKWKKKKFVYAALVSFALSNQNQGSELKPARQFETMAQYPDDFTNKLSESKNYKTDSALVAPIFHHGDGIGCFGCVSIMSPVFISEQDAMQIILKECEKEGLVFESSEQPEQNLMIGIHTHQQAMIDGEKNHDTTEYKELVFDLYNKKLNLAICYVSEQKNGQYSDRDYEGYSSVSCERIRITAEKIRNEIKKANRINAVVFYDPVAFPEKMRPISHEEQMHLAYDSLKAQVLDFVKWYKSQKKKH